MLCNLPDWLTREALLRVLDGAGFAGCYDCVYLPTDFSTRQPLGYAFVNLVARRDAERFKLHFQSRASRQALPGAEVVALLSPARALPLFLAEWQRGRPGKWESDAGLVAGRRPSRLRRLTGGGTSGSPILCRHSLFEEPGGIDKVCSPLRGRLGQAYDLRPGLSCNLFALSPTSDVSGKAVSDPFAHAVWSSGKRNSSRSSERTAETNDLLVSPCSSASTCSSLTPKTHELADLTVDPANHAEASPRPLQLGWAAQADLRRKPCTAERTSSNRTTVMISNLPQDLTRDTLLRLLDEAGFARRYDCVYLPTHFRTRQPVGYAFINLVTREDTERFQLGFHGFSQQVMPSAKVVALLSPARALPLFLAEWNRRQSLDTGIL